MAKVETFKFTFYLFVTAERSLPVLLFQPANKWNSTVFIM